MSNLEETHAQFKVLRNQALHLHALAVSFYNTGNPIVSDQLTSIAEIISRTEDNLQKLREDILDEQLNEAKQNTGNILKTLLSVSEHNAKS